MTYENTLIQIYGQSDGKENTAIVNKSIRLSSSFFSKNGVGGRLFVFIFSRYLLDFSSILLLFVGKLHNQIKIFEGGDF